MQNVTEKSLDDVTVIGITGSIGMGKSAAAAALREMGLPVHDADAAVHALLGPGGAAVAAVGAAFPEALAGDHIDRAALGRLVFADPEQKKVLESILHPIVIAASRRFVKEKAAEGHDVIVLDIPLLYETGGEERVDIVICVTAPPEVQRARVLARPGMTAERFARILQGQMPDAEKRQRADYVLETDKGFDDMRAQLKKIVDGLRHPPIITPHDPRNHP